MAEFLAGELDPDKQRTGWWLPNVRAATSVGRRFERVRVVSTPPTDYSRYGLFTSRDNIAAGEDIRYLARTEAQQLGLPNHDYWLFDSRKLARLHFDDSDDRLLTVEIIEDDHEQIVQHNYWRDVAWHHATRRGDFVAQHAIRGVGD